MMTVDLPPWLHAVHGIEISGELTRTLLVDAEGSEYEIDGFGPAKSPEGEVVELRWIEGSRAGVTLHAPQGMAIVGDTLFVADIDCVRGFHRVTGAPVRELCLEGASLLADLTANPDGDLYLSDRGTERTPGALYLLRRTADVPQILALADGTTLEGENLGDPSGVFADSRGLYVVTFRSGEFFRVTRKGMRVPLLRSSDMELDGIVSFGERGFLLSSWGDSTVYRFEGDGEVSPLIRGLETPARLGYDSLRDRVLVPLYRRDALVILEVG